MDVVYLNEVWGVSSTNRNLLGLGYERKNFAPLTRLFAPTRLHIRLTNVEVFRFNDPVVSICGPRCACVEFHIGQQEQSQGRRRSRLPGDQSLDTRNYRRNC